MDASRKKELKKQHKATAGPAVAQVTAEREATEARRWQIIDRYLSTASSVALHAYVANSNFDCTRRAIRLLVDSPRLDFGTAVLLFWKLGADYLIRLDPSNIPEINRDDNDLTLLIEQRCVARFYSVAQISIDPFELPMRPGEYESVGPVAREAASCMYEKIVGSTSQVDAVNCFDDGLPDHILVELNAVDLVE
jgi:hypothetical protein